MITDLNKHSRNVFCPCSPRPANQAATRVQSTTVTRSVSTFVSAPESPTKMAKRGPNFGFSGADGLAEGMETCSISSSENSSSRRNSRTSKGDRDSVIIELSEPVSRLRRVNVILWTNSKVSV